MSKSINAVGFPHAPISQVGITRRTVLGIGIAGLIDALCPSVTFAGSKPAYTLPHRPLTIPSEIIQVREDPIPIVLIWLDGGASQYETWDPKKDGSIKGPFDSIKSPKGIEISALFPRMQEIVDHTLILRNIFTHGLPVDHPNQTLATFQGSTEFDINKGPFIPVHPSFPGRLMNEVLLPQGKFGLMVFNASYDHSSSPHPVTIPQGTLKLEYPGKQDGYPSPFGEHLDRAILEARIGLHKKLQSEEKLVVPQTEKYKKYFLRGIEKLEDDLPKAFDLSTELSEERDRFGRNPLGNAALTIKRLVRAGLKFMEVHYGFWDTHYKLEKETKWVTPDLDKALPALIEELKDEAIIVVATEFGRTPKFNAGFPSVPGWTPGRDHWGHSFSILLAGKRIPPGVIGQTDNNGTIVKSDDGLGEFLSVHLFPTIFKIAGYEMRYTADKKLFPVWPIV